MEAVPFHIGITTDDITTSMRDLAAGLGVSWTEPTQPDGLLHTVDGRELHRPLSCPSLEMHDSGRCSSRPSTVCKRPSGCVGSVHDTPRPAARSRIDVVMSSVVMPMWKGTASIGRDNTLE